jgi:hypothetical protein
MPRQLSPLSRDNIPIMFFDLPDAGAIIVNLRGGAGCVPSYIANMPVLGGALYAGTITSPVFDLWQE